MPGMGPGEAQGRVVLAGRMFRDGVGRLARERRPTPAEKEALLARVEEEAWALPADLLRGAPGDEWELRALADPRVDEAVARAVAAARRGA